MDALIKDESRDFATLNFEKVVKNPEIPCFKTQNSHFPLCEGAFLPFCGAFCHARFMEGNELALSCVFDLVSILDLDTNP